jgi:diguanylate cyclase (GGDEF)-like protein
VRTIALRLRALRELFLSYHGTENEEPIRREQATLLFGISLLLALLGVGSCTLFTFAFERQLSLGVAATDCVIILLYVGLVAGGVRWRRQRCDAPFINLSVKLLIGLGLAWGVLVNLFALSAKPDQQGILVGLIMALVSTPMLAVPLSASLAFYLPISILCSVAILMQPIQIAAIYSFFGFLGFALTGLLYMNKAILERSIGRRNLEKEHRTVSLFLREFQEVSSDWLWETNRDGIFRNVGSRMATVLQTDKAQLENLSLCDLPSRRTKEEDDFCKVVLYMQRRTAFKDAILAVLIGGYVRWLSLTGHPVHDDTGVFVGYRGIGSDVTEARVGRQRIEFLASHDGLTDLLNRKAFVGAVSAACDDLATDRFALLLIDLDNFKGINDDLGHLAGDDVLRSVAERICASIRPRDIGARIGGDEFAVLVNGAGEADALEIGGRITKALSAPILIDNLAITPWGSIGVSLYPLHGTDTESLIRRADLALYRAKERGKKAACLFEAEFEHEHLGRIRLQAELASALDEEQLFLHYQPIVDVRSEDIVSVEALVRWRHPTRGVLAAGVFMPSVEASDLMERLGEYVLRLACNTAAGWQNPVPVAVNLSPKQLRSGRFVTLLKTCLMESGLPPSRLALEVTETVFLVSADRTLGQLKAIRDLGVRIVLDDFGTGYSSLTYLRGFDVDGIKIDASFTRDLPGSQKVAAIVRTIGRLASDMNIYVVAEGVETIEQLKWLRGNGIAFAQGYLLGRPGEDTLFSEERNSRFDPTLWIGSDVSMPLLRPSYRPMLPRDNQGETVRQSG